ncbi:hypothetical protein HUJ05_005450 [Dendroctonus ponderosae]|nr:hypothetical protein HUJ05_005450 [Dendroctonus ponderosae]
MSSAELQMGITSSKQAWKSQAALDTAWSSSTAVSTTPKLRSLSQKDFTGLAGSGARNNGAEEATAPSTTWGYFMRNHAANMPPYEPPNATTGKVSLVSMVPKYCPPRWSIRRTKSASAWEVAVVTVLGENHQGVEDGRNFQKKPGVIEECGDVGLVAAVEENGAAFDVELFHYQEAQLEGFVGSAEAEVVDRHVQVALLVLGAEGAAGPAQQQNSDADKHTMTLSIGHRQLTQANLISLDELLLQITLQRPADAQLTMS